VNRIILALLINVLATGAYAASATDSAFQNLSDEYISDLTNFSPVTATMIGDHSADGDIDQVDAAARAESLTLLREYRDALAALDRDDMSRANQVDAELLLHEIESSIWSTEQLQEWAWNPISTPNNPSNRMLSINSPWRASCTVNFWAYNATSSVLKPVTDQAPLIPPSNCLYIRYLTVHFLQHGIHLTCLCSRPES